MFKAVPGMMFFGYFFSALFTLPSLAIIYPMLRRMRESRLFVYLSFSAFASIGCAYIVATTSNAWGDKAFIPMVGFGLINGTAFWLIERPDKP